MILKVAGVQDMGKQVEVEASVLHRYHCRPSHNSCFIWLPMETPVMLTEFKHRWTVYLCEGY